jgi:hypothetical protein
MGHTKRIAKDSVKKRMYRRIQEGTRRRHTEEDKARH